MKPTERNLPGTIMLVGTLFLVLLLSVIYFPSFLDDPGAARFSEVAFFSEADGYATDPQATKYELFLNSSHLTVTAEGQTQDTWTHTFRNGQRRSAGTSTSEGVYYHDVFPAVDVRLYDKGLSRAGYDFIVHPQTNPSAISLQLSGPGQAYLDELTRELVLPVAGGKQIRHTRPIAYQRIENDRLAVAADFTLSDDGVLGFRVGDYDPRYALVIDPAIVLAEAANITDNNQADPIDLSRCFTPNQLQTNIQFLVSGTPSITYLLPPGIMYVPGTATIETQTSPDGTTFAAVEADVSDPRAPVFTLDNAVDVGDFIRLQLDIMADCEAISGTNDIDVEVTVGADESFGEATIDVLEADLSVLAHTPVTLMINELDSVEITIRNGGLGQLDSFLFLIDTTDISATTTRLSANNGTIELTPTRVGSSIQYSITPDVLRTIGNMDTIFDNTESIVLTRTVLQENCQPSERIFRYNDFYRAIYGCPGSCQTPEPIAPGAFSIPNVFVTLSATGVLVQQSDYCQPTISDITVTNTSSPTDQLQSAYNLSFINTIGENISGYRVDDLDVTSIELVTDNGLVPLTFEGGNNAPAMGDFSQLTTLQPGSGLTDLDQDGEFDDLGINQSFTLRYTYTYVRDACNVNDMAGRDFYAFPYTDDCGREGLTVEFDGSTFNYKNDFRVTGVEGPASVLDGDTFTITFCESGGPAGNWLQNGQLATCPDRNTLLTVDVPQGLTAVADASYEISADGSTVTASMTFTDGDPNCFPVMFTGDCSQLPGEEANYGIIIPYEFTNDCNSSGGCEPQIEGCSEELVRIRCVVGSDCAFGPCARQPVVEEDVSVFRTTLGFRTAGFDINDPGQQYTSVEEIPAGNRIIGTACDSIAIEGSITLCGDNTNVTDNVFLRISVDRWANRPDVSPLEEGTRGVFTLTRADGTVALENVPLPTPQTANVEGRDFIIYDLSALLPNSEMRGGDIIDFRTDHAISVEANVQSESLTPLSAFRISSFSLPNANDRVIPEAKTESFACIERDLTFNVHAARLTGRQQQYSTGLYGCQPSNFLSGINVRASGSEQDYYPNEIRPFYIIDSLTVVMGRDYLPGRGSLRIATRSPGYSVSYGLNFDPALLSMTPANPQDLPGRLIAGSPNWIFRFYNTNRTYMALAEYRTFANKSNNTYDLNVPARLNCQNSGRTYDSYFDGQRYAHNNPEPGCFTERRFIGGHAWRNPPAVALVNRSGTQVLDEKQECFEVDLTKFRRPSIRNVYVAADYLASNLASDLRVASITNRTTGEAYELLEYEDGIWAKITPILNSTATEVIPLEVCVTASSCTAADQLPMFMGYSCQDDFPDSPRDRFNDIDECANGRVFLPVIPGDAAVQLDLISQPGTVDLCTPLTYTLRVNSSQIANILDPFVTAQLPAGMTLQSAEVQYPINTGTFEDVTGDVTLTSGGTELELFLGAATAVNDSLLGTNSADTDAYPGGEDRQAAVRLTFLTSCETPVGDVLRFSVGATQICGDPARGSGIRVRSTPITVDGTLPDFLPVLGDITPSVTELTCDDATISAELNFLDRIAGDGKPSIIDRNKDSVIVILPAETSFVPGSFSCTGDNCPVLGSSVTLPDGRQRVALGYATNVSIPDAGAFDYTISYVANGLGLSSDCGNEVVFEVQATTTVEDVGCVTEAGGVCPFAITVIADQAEVGLELNKAQIVDLTAVATRTDVEDYTFTGSFTVTERPVPAGQMLVVDVYCVDADGNPTGAAVGSATVTGPIAVDETVAYTGTATGACNDELYFEINPVTADGDPQCACVPVAVVVPTISVCDISIINILTPCDNVDEFTLDFDVAYDFFNASVTPVEVFVDGVSQGTMTPTGTTGALEYRGIVVAGPRFDGEIRAVFQSVDSCEVVASYDLIACPAACPNEPDAIGGNVFSDANFNGADAGAEEVGVANTRIRVFDCDNNLVCDTYSDLNGNWSCDGLMASDTFRVQFSNPLQDSLAPGFAGADAGGPTQYVIGGDCDVNYAVIDSTTVPAASLDNVQIGNYVWEDTNRDGRQNSCEPPIPNVPVALYTPDGTLVATTTTGPDGTYYFTNNDTPGETWLVGTAVQPNTDYVVAFGTDGADVNPFRDGFLSTGGEVYSLTDPNVGNDVLDSDPILNVGGLPFSGFPTTSITTNGNGANHTVDAGFVTESAVAIGSTVFLDNNNNGVQNPGQGDIGIAGVPVDLYAPGPDGMVGGGDDLPISVGNVVTDADGNYLFENLPPGNYYVQIPATAFNPGDGTALDTFTRSSTPTDTRDNQQDGDDNGTQADGEAGAINSPVINLSPGEEPAGAIFEMFQGMALDDNLANSADADGDMTVDFGLFAPVSLGDTVFVDLNENGLQDAEEPALAGVTVTVFNADGTPVTMDVDGGAYTNVTTTDADGFYTFDGLPPGNYYVIFDTRTAANQEFYAFTAPNRGDDEKNDSDANVRSGRSANSGVIPAGQRNPDLDAGVVCNIEVFAGKGGEVCGAKPINILEQERLEPASLSATWITEGDGTFTTADGTTIGATAPAATAAFYTAGTADRAAGFVTLTLTSEDPAGPCVMESSTVTYKFNDVDCGTFPNRP